MVDLELKIATVIGASLLLVFALIIVVLWIILRIITKSRYNELLYLAIFMLTVSLWEFVRNGYIFFAAFLTFAVYFLYRKKTFEGKKVQGVGTGMGETFFSLPAYGFLIMTVLFLVEILKFLSGHGKYDDTIFANTGIIVYVLSLVAEAAIKLSYDNMLANEANATKTQFLANMSHEIRTPLNTILGFDELILRNPNGDKVPEYAKKIQTAGTSLRGIIDSVLDLSKIEAGKMEFHEREYRLSDLLDGVLDMMSQEAAKKNLALNVNVDRNLYEDLYGDDSHIAQILTNLLDNAIKYTKEGSVTFTVKMECDYSNEKECDILFSVKDTGLGIRPEDKKRLFEKFERLDYTENHDIAGTGLGMSIVANLLAAMNSCVMLESTYGEGSDFYFTLRQKATSYKKIGQYGCEKIKNADESQVARPDQPFVAPDAQILIVDDVELNLNVACGLLAPLKMQIDTATSGMKAIEMVQNKKYDVIFMDHMMPVMDGFETAAKIKSLSEEKNDPGYRQIPIIALTANAVSGMKEKFLDAGFADFITKPVEGPVLEKMIRKWLPKDRIKPIEQTDYASDVTGEWDIAIEGVDIGTAKKYAPTIDMYRESLKTYVKGLAQTKKHILTYRDEDDLNDYTVTVHGLKSSSKIIGAIDVSEKARVLEEYGHLGESAKAYEGADELISSLDKLENAIKSAVEISDEEKMLSDEEMGRALDTLRGCAIDFDMDGLMAWEDEFSDCTVADDKKDDWEDIKSSVHDVAFVEILERIDKIAHIS